MAALRDIWVAKGMRSAEVAGRAGISIGTLYKCNRREDVNFSTVVAVCKVLGLSLDEYQKLSACGMADRYKTESE